MKKSIPIFLFSILIILSINIKVFASDTIIPDDAIEYNGHYYKVFNLHKSWDDAKTYCELLSGYLVIIDSNDEQLFIEALILNNSENVYWLGANYKDNDWYWNNGAKIQYENWAIGEPSGIDGNNQNMEETCLQIYAKEYYDNNIGEWNDINSYGDENSVDNFYSLQNTGFICEWDDLSFIDNNNTNKQNQRENHNNDKKVVYEFHIDNLSIIGGLSIFGGISFIGLIIKKKNNEF